MSREKATLRWAIQWHQKNLMEGEVRYFMWDGVQPRLFLSRAEARAAILEEWGYIRERDDLRREPHGWRLPKAIRVQVVLRELR